MGGVVASSFRVNTVTKNSYQMRVGGRSEIKLANRQRENQVTSSTGTIGILPVRQEDIQDRTVVETQGRGGCESACGFTRRYNIMCLSEQSIGYFSCGSAPFGSTVPPGSGVSCLLE